MAGKDFLGRGMDVIDDINLRFAAIENAVKLLQSSTRPTMPGYNFISGSDANGDYPLDPVEGQVAVGRDVNDNNIYHYANGRWRPFWQDADLINGWVGLGDPYHPVQYTLINGIFRTRGAMSGGTIPSVAFVADSEFLPQKTQRITVVRDTDPGVIEVDNSSGSVTVLS